MAAITLPPGERPYAFAEKTSVNRRIATALLLGTVGVFGISAFRQQIEVKEVDDELAMAQPAEGFTRLVASYTDDVVATERVTAVPAAPAVQSGQAAIAGVDH